MIHCCEYINCILYLRCRNPVAVVFPATVNRRNRQERHVLRVSDVAWREERGEEKERERDVVVKREQISLSRGVGRGSDGNEGGVFADFRCQCGL